MTLSELRRILERSAETIDAETDQLEEIATSVDGIGDESVRDAVEICEANAESISESYRSLVEVMKDLERLIIAIDAPYPMKHARLSDDQ